MSNVKAWPPMNFGLVFSFILHNVPMTSCAQTAFYPKELPAQEREAFIDFYFGNQDSKRCVVQVDTDMPLIPPAQGMILLPAAIQMPVIEYSIPSVEFPINTFFEYITMECEKID